MPNVTAFQKADRLALLVAIDNFFALLGELPTCEEATKLAFTIRRCEYQGNPADVKNLMSLLGWSKTKVLAHLKEVQEFFEFRTVKDGSTTGARCSGSTASKDRRPPPSSTSACRSLTISSRRARRQEMAPRTGADIAARGSDAEGDAGEASCAGRGCRLAGGLDGFRYRQGGRPSVGNEAFDHSVEELIEPVEHPWHHFVTIPSIITIRRAAATPQYGSRWWTTERFDGHGRAVDTQCGR